MRGDVFSSCATWTAAVVFSQTEMSKCQQFSALQRAVSSEAKRARVHKKVWSLRIPGRQSESNTQYSCHGRVARDCSRLQSIGDSASLEEADDCMIDRSVQKRLKSLLYGIRVLPQLAWVRGFVTSI